MHPGAAEVEDEGELVATFDARVDLVALFVLDVLVEGPNR